MKIRITAIIFLSFFIFITGFTSNAFSQENQTIIKYPINDAFVLSDVNHPNDTELEETNTGKEDFLKVWYSWNMTDNGEHIVSIPLLQFDTSDIDRDRVKSAKIFIYPFVLETPRGQAKLVAMPGINQTWNESSITFNNSPTFIRNAIATAFITEPNKWYSFQVKDWVTKSFWENPLTFFIMFEQSVFPGMENVAFYSKEAQDSKLAPYLEIEYYEERSLLSSLQENETDYTLAAIVGVLVAAAAGIGIFIALILRKKSSKQLTAKQVTTTPSEKPRTDSQKQKPSQERKCKLCGKTLVQDFKVCPYCGYRV